jgi:hypothetical protein
MTNVDLLERYINESGYKRSYIAKQLGRTAYCLALKIQGKSKFDADEIDTLCELLKIDVNDRMRIFFAKKVD